MVEFETLDPVNSQWSPSWQCHGYSNSKCVEMGSEDATAVADYNLYNCQVSKCLQGDQYRMLPLMLGPEIYLFKKTRKNLSNVVIWT